MIPNLPKIAGVGRTSAICTFFLVLITAWAVCNSNTTLSGHAFKSVVQLVVYLLTISLLVSTLLENKNKGYNSVIIGSVLIYWFLNLGNSYGDISLAFTNTLLMILLALLSRESKVYAFELFKQVLLVGSIIGIVCYLAYILGIKLPYSVVPYYEDDEFSVYINYGLCYILDTNIGTVRLCGFMNEPGYFGTMIALALCADNMRLKDWKNVIMLIAGFCTLSLAFFVIIGAFLILHYAKKPIIALFWIALILLVFYYLPQIDTNIDILSHFFKRFTVEDGEWMGNSRSSDILDNKIKSMLNGDHTLFGYGNGYISKTNLIRTSHIKTVIIENGFVGFVLIWGSLIFASLKYKAKNNMCIPYIIVFFLSTIQRPQIFNVVYFLMLFGGIDYIVYNKENDVLKENRNENFDSRRFLPKI